MAMCPQGRWDMPLSKESKLQSKEELCFKSLEIAGSNPGTESKPKFDPLSFCRDIEAPRLEQLCQEVAAVTGKPKAII